MHFVAEELRHIMADLGFKTVNEMVGQSQKLNMKNAINHFKAKGIDLSNILHKPKVPNQIKERNTKSQEHNLENVLDIQILKKAKLAIQKKKKQELKFHIKNTNRTIGAIISYEISKLYGSKGLPEDTLKLNFTGTAGQSFGAFATNGLLMKIEGTVNDYFGKGLSGAKLIAKVPEKSSFVPQDNIIIGNVALYGATAGEAYINGIAGERFCVRNSGARAVVEGVGDHGCEYMTGGIALILGDIGRNFAAGMSGGIAYIYNDNAVFDEKKFNLEMVELESPQKDDIEIIRELLENHINYTKSPRANEILKNWQNFTRNFIKVMPTDYKNALEMMSKKKFEKST